MKFPTPGLSNFSLGILLSATLLPVVWSVPVQAAFLPNLSGSEMSTFTSYPVTTLEAVTPKVLLALSKDHNYYFKAYNDFTDIDGDGVIDTTYKNDFEYYGYFDPDKCYTYTTENLGGTGNVELFVPAGFTTDHYCDAAPGEWSGNFLNWVAMDRMSIVRKIFHGGWRYEDGSDFTILQRSTIPPDAHAWAKYYNGDDIPKLTPFTTSQYTPTNDDGVDDIDEGITLCNFTFATSGTSESTDAPPIIRAVRGNYSLWAAGEVLQCHFSDDQALEEVNDPESPTGKGKKTVTVSSKGFGVNNNVPAASGINAYSESPSSSEGLTFGGFGPDFDVNIKMCVDGLIANSGSDNERCKKYPSGNYKPTGLLQEYGEDEKIHFGAFTGSYSANLSGGVLRKHVGPLSDEINVDTDGTFKADPNSAVPAVGVTRALDLFEPYGYDLSLDRKGTEGSRYTGGAPNKDCPGPDFTEGHCASWGNPISEVYAESMRYFAGLVDPTPEFNSADSSYIGGLQEDLIGGDKGDWPELLDETNFCAGLNIIVMNSSVISYDEETDHFADIGGSPDAKALTNTLGGHEGLTGNYFVGRVGGSAGGEYCTAKALDATNGLGDVVGVCPEAPTLSGTYQMAGMAWYARTHDIRSGLASDVTGVQSVTTYAVQLATNIPIITLDTAALNAVDPAVDASGLSINIIPAYRRLAGADGTPDDSAGSLSGFEIVEPLHRITPGTVTDVAYSGKAFIQWDEREQGGDFDQDIWGILDYELYYKDGNWQVIVTTDVIDATAYSEQLFGFIIGGTTKDGFHAYSGAYRDNAAGAAYSDPDLTIPDCNVSSGSFSSSFSTSTGSSFGGSGSTSGCKASDGPSSYTFIAGDTGAELPPDPLYLAAKYGGFDDSNGNGIPDLQSEYDIRDENGRKVEGGDGVPDTYYFVTNPAALEKSLRAVFDQIIERVASGTAAAVVASEQEGTGAVYQALYDPVKTDNVGREVGWIGTLHALFIDPKGFLREDADGDAALDGYDEDPVIDIYFDENERRSRVRRYASSTAAIFTQSGDPTVGELETLQPIWNARSQLASLSDDALDAQRPYESPASEGRYITTWLDSDWDGVVDEGEQSAFVDATFTSDNFGWLDVYSEDADGNYTTDETHKLVNFIRGIDQDGYRSRQLDYNKNGTVQTMRLGDIVDSTPTVQGAPAESFDILSLDLSYNVFRRQYRNRRNVVYVGANDGMIHAFNGGFFDVETLSFKTQLTDETAHPLGSEIWAYIPKNLLGHLQWLVDDDYSHVFYADLKPLLFDARVFPDDDTHPNGWGTILVVGMRLGGGQDTNGITLDTSADTYGNDNDVATKSAYVMLDVTDPEQPPQLIAELSPPTLQFTTSYPSVTAISRPQTLCDLEPELEDCPADSDETNKWYLVFGSGPTNLGTVESTQTARVFAYDLNLLVDPGTRSTSLVTTGPFNGGYADTGEANSFVGEFTTADQNFNMKAEAVYFGTVGSDDGTGGNIYRMTIDEEPSPADWGNVFNLLDVNRPFVARPSITLDKTGKTWILAGSGRQFTNADKSSVTTQSLYGFIDPNKFTVHPTLHQETVDDGNFIDVTDAVVYTNGSVDLDGDGTIDSSFEEVTADVATAGGWRLDYAANSLDPAERTLSNQTLIGGIVLSSAFTPATTQCGGEGTSRLIGRAFNSGLVPPVGIFGTEPCGGSCPDETVEAIAIGSEYLGSGLASSPSIHIGNQEVPGKVTVIVQQSTGAITGNQAQTTTGINNGEVSWQEYRSE